VRFPEITLAIIGIIYGFVAWLLHATLLKRLEKFVPAGLIELPSELTGPPAEPPQATAKCLTQSQPGFR
jgi:hypothetical protein